jgi:hypothetical protein
MRRWTVGKKEKAMPTDMTRFQAALRKRVAGTIPPGEARSRALAVQRRMSTRRLEKLFAEQDAAEGAD